MALIRIIYQSIYLCITLLKSLPALKKAKNSTNMSDTEKSEFAHFYAKKWAKGFFDTTGSTVTVSGIEHLPEGPVLFVSNHVGNFDIPTLMGYIPKSFGFISKTEMKKAPLVSDWMDVLDCVFIDRNDRRQSVKALREGGQLLKNGHSILIFPEGTRSKGGPIGEFKAGGTRLAKDGEVPIVPIVIKGTAEIYENGAKGLKPATVTIEVLPAFSKEHVIKTDGKLLLEEVRQVMLAASH
ncbi:lysophospholipid acyltransferase family protein [Bacillus sp. 2205SS5-2]|uniref:lysophospholipid acyltransferase family protein n=1 Tax=Bacillus sp. 2205SS5-2 TaxID=3109031 RepID=UPI003006B9C8